MAERDSGLTESELENLAALEERDNPFPNIDYRAFAARQGHAELASALV